MGPIIIGNPGTSMVLTIPTTATSYPFEGTCDQGLFYTLAGIVGDITLQYLDHAA